MLNVYANYGAMFATVELTIRSISNGIAIAFDGEGSETRFNVEDVRNARPASGSPIGLYWNRRDAY